MSGAPTARAEGSRRPLADDRYRPAYHFTAPANFLGDPNGTIWWDGAYHLFYQHNPDEAYDNPRRMHWGSCGEPDDLVHWQDLPIALAPEPGGPDRRGCYSGGAIELDGAPALVYYGNPDGICVATSADGLRTWSRHPCNPLIPHPTDPRRPIWRAVGPLRMAGRRHGGTSRAAARSRAPATRRFSVPLAGLRALGVPRLAL